jgi:hypothetical protein
VSNLAILDRIDLSDDLMRIIEGRMDALRLPEVLHEFTHHSCLKSPVGTAVGLLNMLCQRMAWNMNELRNDRAAGKFMQYFARYHALTVAIRPLSEGIAQFAEYDMLPSPIEIRSLPMIFALLTATRYYGSAIEEDILRTKLWLARAEAIEKKASLLSSSFRSAGGGYLLGYTLVRSTWAIAARNDPFFADADAFLTYLMEVAFGDYGLVNLILDVPQGELDLRSHKYAATYASRIVDRLTGFFNAPDLRQRRERAERYKQEFVFDPARAELVYTGKGDAPYALADSSITHFSAHLFNDADEVARGAAHLESALQAIRRDMEFGNDGRRRALPGQHAGILNRRHYFWLGTLSVDWTFGDGKITIATDSMTTTFEVSPPANGPRSGKGSLEVVFVLEKGDLQAVLVTETGKTVLLDRLPSQNDRERLLKTIDKRQTFEEADRNLAEFLVESADQVLPEAHRQRIIKECGESVDRIYAPAALSSIVSPSAHQSFLAASAEGGLLSALDDDVDAVETIAAASFLAHSRPPQRHFEEGLRRFDYTLGDIDALNQTFAKKFGAKLFTFDGGNVFSLF